MKTRRCPRFLIILGLCVGLGAAASASAQYSTGSLQPGLYRVEGRMQGAQAGNGGAGSRDALQKFQAAMSSELAQRRVCFTPDMARRGAAGVVTENRPGCSFQASREDASGFQGRLSCPGDAGSEGSTVAGRIFDSSADYTITSSGPMQVGQTMSRIDFRVRFVATRIGECGR